MAHPYIGEIKMFGFGKCPKGYAKCDGSSLNKDQYATLCSLLANQFGSKGDEFYLPDMRGRIPMHQGSGYTVGDNGGQEWVDLGEDNIAQHSHNVMATSNQASEPEAKLHFLAQTDFNLYGHPENLVALNEHAVSLAGYQNASDPNIQPCLVINFCIALMGADPFSP